MASPVVMPRSRALDWTCAAMILAIGIILALPGNTFNLSPGYKVLADLASEGTWAMILIVAGGLRIVALLINGTWGEGSPVLRGAAAAFGVIVWITLAAGFIDLSIDTGNVSAGVAIYMVLLGADLFSCARAGADAVRARQVAGHARLQRV